MSAKSDEGNIIEDEFQMKFGCLVKLIRKKKKSLFNIFQTGKKKTLFSEIEKNIEDGTTIMSDGWPTYKSIVKNLARHNFVHYFVNHKKKFVDHENKNIHTQNIESLWSQLRRFLKKYGTNVRSNLKDYIAEFLVRREFEDEISDFILEVIKI